MDNVYLAPLAGITDAAMRQICLDYGPCLTFTEMISVNGLLYKNRKTNDLLSLAENEKTVGIQLFGSEAPVVADIALELELRMGKKIREININMGCPAPKIVKNGEGAALLLDIKKAEQIISSTVKKTTLPVTVKFRKGFYASDNIAADFARMCEAAGAERIYIHGRTREQYYSGISDRNAVAEAVRAVNIPVIGNGDIFSANDAVSLLEETGCAGIMVARGALGNPFLFREIKELFSGETVTPVTPEERADAFLRQLRLCISEKGESLAVRQMRKHGAYYIKGVRNSAVLRSRIVAAGCENDFRILFDEYVRNQA